MKETKGKEFERNIHSTVSRSVSQTMWMKNRRFLYIISVICVNVCAVHMKVIPTKETRHKREENAPTLNTIKYLTRYGYLKDEQSTTATTDDSVAVGASRPDEELRTAVRKFQKMANLPITGQLDEPTILMMRRSRCGMADVTPSSNTPVDFKVGSNKWKKSNISYRLDKSTFDLRRSQIETELARAFDLWSSVSSLSFHPVAAAAAAPKRNQQQPEPADIVISFYVGDHNDETAFDGKGNILAHAFPPGDGTGGDVHFDDDETWTVASKEGVNLFTVAAHELGHSLGIQHSHNQQSLMFPWYQGYDPNYKQLHSDDVNAIQSLYGGRSSYTPKVVSDDTPPDACCTDFDTVATIRGELFFFKKKWFWRRHKNWEMKENPELITRFWTEFPSQVGSVDAVYERPHDHRIVFFSGKRYFEFDGVAAVAGFPRDGRALTDLGLPPDVDRIDAAIVWDQDSRRRNVYLYSGNRRWRLDSSGRRLDTTYPADGRERTSSNRRRPSPKPKEIENEPPVIKPSHIRLSFTHPDGGIYVFKENYYWRLDKDSGEMSLNDGKPIQQLWPTCENLSSSSSLPPSSSSSELRLLLMLLMLFLWLKHYSLRL